MKTRDRIAEIQGYAKRLANAVDNYDTPDERIAFVDGVMFMLSEMKK